MTATFRDPEQVLSTVAELLREVIGDDGGLGPPITMDTSFNEDLELESIEFVALAEKLQERYGKSVDFAGWLSGMELGQILALRVGELVNRIVSQKS
ncbi:MAG: acyl carrier protein [Polyangiaceae bacterium]